MARLLSFGFYILAARALAPTGFGEIRYTITLALLAFGPLQVLGTAIQREMGAIRGRPGENEIIGTSLLVALILWLPTIAVTTVLGVTGITGVARPAGLAMVITGTAIFQIYYLIARGRGDIRRAAVTYAGGSLFQLTVFVVYILVVTPTPLMTLAVFSVSSVVPVLACEIVSPIVRGRHLVFSSRVARQLWRLGLPLAVAQCAFLVWLSADQIWVEQAFGSHEVGLYAAAKNLAQLFIVLPAAVSGVLMPRVAELSQSGHQNAARRLLKRATGASFLLSALIGIVVVLTSSRLLRGVFGEAYASAAGSLSVLAVAMVVYAPFSALVSASVGWGRPGVYSLGIGVSACVEVAILATTGSHVAETAAWSVAVSIVCGLVAVVLTLRKWPLTSQRDGING